MVNKIIEIAKRVLLGDKFDNEKFMQENPATPKTRVRPLVDGNINLSRVSFPGGYQSPSGGFCNYARFTGRGINPATGRSNQVKVVEARTLEDAVVKVEKQNGLQQVQLSVIPMEPPTERQIPYAKDLGIQIPAGACKEDVICMISRVAESVDDTPLLGCPQALANYLHEARVLFSAYIGWGDAVSYAVAYLPEREKCRFYAYCVWCWLRSEDILSPVGHPKASLFEAFATWASTDPDFLSRLAKKYDSNFLSPNGNEATVRTVKTFFQEQGEKVS